MIKTIKRSDRHNMYDLKIRQMVSIIILQDPSMRLVDFREEFRQQIKLIPQMSAYSCEYSYVLVRKEFYLQVCHRNVAGKIDRVLLEVFSIYNDLSEWQ